MSKKHLIIPDGHAHPDHDNNRAVWVGELIAETKPDVVIDIGDSADMASLSSYDKGKRGHVGRTYARDMAAHGDFQEKIWDATKRRKKKLPYRVRLIGNHEERIDRAIDLSPELEGAIGYNDLQNEHFYDRVVYYNGGTPGVINVDGVSYAHYFVSGALGRPISGEHPAHSLLVKNHTSCVSGHTHYLDFSTHTRVDGSKLMGLHVGCLVDYDNKWAGEAQKLWWTGAIILNNVEDGVFDLETVSLDALRKEYGHLTN